MMQERCPHCQHTLLPKAEFCHHCGGRLAAAAGQPEGPRLARPRLAPDGRMICGKCTSLNKPDAAHCRICGTTMRPHISANPGELVDARGLRIGLLAGFWVRFAAYAVDSLVLIILSMPALLILDSTPGTAGISEFQFANVALTILYMVIGWSAFGTTFGKRAFKLYVVRPDGSPPSAPRALLRQFATVPSLFMLGFGYFMAGIRPDKRALHDLVADTYVVIRESAVDKK